MGVLQIARRWNSATDLPDVSKCFRRDSSKHPCQRPPSYFAWGCFRYFSWKPEPRQPLRLSFPLMVAAWPELNPRTDRFNQKPSRSRAWAHQTGPDALIHLDLK